MLSFIGTTATMSTYCVLKFTAAEGRYYCDLKKESFRMEDLE